jgi:hypothetical protein
VPKSLRWSYQAKVLNSHDLDRTVAMVGADFELVDAARRQTFRGPDGCRQWLQGGLTAAPDATAESTS